MQELEFAEASQMKLLYDNQGAPHIDSNKAFHERNKHIRLIVISFEENMLFGFIITSYVNFNDQLANFLIKSLRVPHIGFTFNKLGAYNLYTPTWRGVLGYIV